MSSRIVAWLLLLILLGTGALFFWYWQQRPVPNALVYNQFSEQFEPAHINDDLDRPIIREQNLNDNPDGLKNYTILRGYFDSYDESSQSLKVKVRVAYTSGSIFQPYSLQLPLSANLYCAPTNFTDQNSGRVIPTQELTIPVMNGATLYLPTEKPLTFSNLLAQSSEQTFLFIQLTDNFQENEANTIHKLIAVGLCE